MLARLLLVRSLKSVTLGNRVAVKGTLRRGLRSSFVREELLLIWLSQVAGNDFGSFRIVVIKNPSLLIFQKQKTVPIVRYDDEEIRPVILHRCTRPFGLSPRPGSHFFGGKVAREAPITCYPIGFKLMPS